MPLLTWLSNLLGFDNYKSGSLRITRSEFTSIVKDVQKTTTPVYPDDEGLNFSNYNQWDTFKHALLTRCENDKTYTHMLRALCLHRVVYDKNDEGNRI